MKIARRATRGGMGGRALATSYVLIDFENVQPKELGAFGGGEFKVMVFIGPAQPTVPVGLASALQALGHAGSYVHIEGRGPNALDMHIAYYIGRLAVEDPGAVFHIISRDRDYDPLIRHLQTRQIECTRWKSVAEISAARVPVPVPAPRAHAPKAAPKPAPKAAATPGAKAAPKAASRPVSKVARKAVPKVAAKAASNRVDDVIRNLEKRVHARPATAKALVSTVRSHFRGTGITDAEVDAIVDELKKRGLITVKEDKVTYQLTRA